MSKNNEKIEPEEQKTEKTEKETSQPKVFAKKIKPETKTALITAWLSLISIIALYCVAFSNQITDCNLIFGGIIGGIVGGIFGGIFGGSIVGGIIGGIVGGSIVGGNFGGIVGGSIVGGSIVGGIFGSGKKQISDWTIPSLIIVFLLPFIAVIVPLSKYHNLNQIERDKKIVEILQISAEKDKIMITLPYEHCKEHSYLEKVFSMRGEDKEMAWKDITVPCRERNKYWYEATFDITFLNKLPADKENKKATLTLFFDHAWEDYETTKTVF